MQRRVVVIFIISVIITFFPLGNIRAEREKRRRPRPTEIPIVRPTEAPVPPPTFTPKPTVAPIPTVEVITLEGPTASPTPAPTDDSDPLPTIETVILDGVPRGRYGWFRLAWPKWSWWKLFPPTYFFGFLLGWG